MKQPITVGVPSHESHMKVTRLYRYLPGLCICEVGKAPMGEILSLSHHGLVSCGRVPCQVEINLHENTIFYGSFNFG